ncbi:DUF4329 domain-containing protein, partial [Flavobacterium jejuense]
HMQECFTQIGRDGSPQTFCNDYYTSPILEENHYYPFGLKHSGYNANNSQPNYQYKYNGKELQTELGLNTYDYGARNYDPALGRWMNIDPLAEQYRRHTPYAYAVNNPVFFIDPDGMQVADPGDKFKTKDDAFLDFAMQYNGIAINNNVELKTAIYEIKEGEEVFYSYTKPIGYINLDKNGENLSEGTAGELPPDITKGKKVVADGHTHSRDRAGRAKTEQMKKAILNDDNQFSGPDKDNNRTNATNTKGYVAYVALPNGTGLRHDPYVKGDERPAPGTPSIITISKDLPSDPKSPTRVNKVSPNVVPNVMPDVYINGVLDPSKLKTKFDGK